MPLCQFQVWVVTEEERWLLVQLRELDFVPSPPIRFGFEVDDPEELEGFVAEDQAAPVFNVTTGALEVTLGAWHCHDDGEAESVEQFLHRHGFGPEVVALEDGEAGEGEPANADAPGG